MGAASTNPGHRSRKPESTYKRDPPPLHHSPFRDLVARVSRGPRSASNKPAALFLAGLLTPQHTRQASHLDLSRSHVAPRLAYLDGMESNACSACEGDKRGSLNSQGHNHMASLIGVLAELVSWASRSGWERNTCHNQGRQLPNPPAAGGWREAGLTSGLQQPKPHSGN